MAAYITLNTDMKRASGGNVRLMLWTTGLGMSNKVFAIEVLPRSADPNTARYRFSHICSVSELVELPDYDNGDTPYFRTDAVDFLLEHASQVTPILKHMRADIKRLMTDYNVLHEHDEDGILQTCPSALMRGLWNDSTTYLKGSFVIYNNSMWRCIKESKGHIPSIGSAYWERVLTSGNGSGGITLIRLNISDKNGVLVLPDSASFVIIRNYIDSGYHVELSYLGGIYTLSIKSDDHFVFTQTDGSKIRSLRVNVDSTVEEQGVFEGFVVKTTTEMPEATEDLAGMALIYVGATTAAFKKGHLYLCDRIDDTYTWEDITPQPKENTDVVLPDNVMTYPDIAGQPNQVLGIDENGKTAWLNVADVANGGTYWQESI